MTDRCREGIAVTIDEVGAQGDGVGHVDGQKVYVPFALPGETVRVLSPKAKPEVFEILSPSPNRIVPICRHFEACGGCVMQHWDAASYKSWKIGLVRTALARAGLDAPIDEMSSYPDASRRRATFSVRVAQGRAEIGYSRFRSHQFVAVEECPILVPDIERVLPRMQDALSGLLPEGGEARIHITAAANGLDCAAESAPLGPKAQGALVSGFAKTGIVRAVWNGETVFQSSAPFIVSGQIKVPLPVSSFLQAVEACERDMAAFAIESLAGAKAGGRPVCDLFSGLGALSFPAAELSPVTAYEANPHAVEAMEIAARGAKGIKPVRALRRDLYRSPLGPTELQAFSAAIVDPPREGAEAQCRAIAASRLETVVMLSCNPVTFARDAALLSVSGFEIVRLAAFDQFKYSAHIEVAALLKRARIKKGGIAPAPKRVRF
jgi:23S rRNA (uracil1939-C5)-methyltransferase